MTYTTKKRLMQKEQFGECDVAVLVGDSTVCFLVVVRAVCFFVVVCAVVGDGLATGNFLLTSLLFPLRPFSFEQIVV